MSINEIKYSNIDSSVNFIENSKEVGYFESRYVRRGQEYFIVYLSIQSGCDLGCKFCHLTTSKQTKYVENTIDDMVSQAKEVLGHYKKQVSGGAEPKADYMHFNFMARGEIFNSPIFQNKESAQELLLRLSELSLEYGVEAKFLLSTIMPENFSSYDLNEIFVDIKPYIYYSLYSMDNKFRKRWLPKSMEAQEALNRLSKYNERANGKVKIHYAFIKDHNDSEKDINDICDTLLSMKFTPDFNIVRYNSYSEKQGVEPNFDIIKRNADIVEERLNNFVKIIPRVGSDVKASCGMFVK